MIDFETNVETTYSISERGLNLIKSFETFKSHIYHCSAGLAIIGYGKVLNTQEEQMYKSQELTKEKAEFLLRKELAYYEGIVNQFIRSDINQNQYDALVSFVYNTGIFSFKKSGLLKKVNINPLDNTIEDEFMKWAFCNGIRQSALALRRKAESDHYFELI